MRQSTDGDGKSTSNAIGPVLKSGLKIRQRFRSVDGRETFASVGADIFFETKKVFTVNEVGSALLRMADGSASIEEMAKKADPELDAMAVGLFFLALAQAGYLENRFEIGLYENRIPTASAEVYG